MHEKYVHVPAPLYNPAPSGGSNGSMGSAPAEMRSKRRSIEVAVLRFHVYYPHSSG